MLAAGNADKSVDEYSLGAGSSTLAPLLSRSMIRHPAVTDSVLNREE